MNPFFIPAYIDINGGKPLKDDAPVVISGAKNEVLGSMAAALLTDAPVVLENVPYIQDVLDMGHAMIDLGVDLKYNPEHKKMHLHAKKITSNVLSPDTMKFRASYYIWGALLARFAITKEFNSLDAILPGGCNFGERGFNFHFNLLNEILGVDVRQGDEKFRLILPKNQESDDVLYAPAKPSHGATFHYLLTAATARRRTYMYNAALEPEVPSLINMLHRMGAHEIRGKNATAIMAGRHDGLLQGGAHRIMPDRMEAGTYALLAMGAGGKIRLENIEEQSCRPWLNLVREFTNIAPKTTWRGNPMTASMTFDFTKLDWSKIRGRDIIVSPYPGKETDLEQIWLPILSRANSASTIIDSIWPGRFGTPEEAAEINKFGINMNYISDFGGGALYARIHPSVIKPAVLTAANLRGAMGYIVAAIMAGGRSRIYRPGFATRGYPNLLDSLAKLGVDIQPSDQGNTLPPLPQWNLAR